MKTVWLFLSFACSAPALAHAQNGPITVQSCGRPVVIPHRPVHAVFHDVNMAEMAFVLKLQPFMRGVTGVSGWSKGTAAFHLAQGDIPEIAPRYPSLEQLVAAGADLFVAGWNYGMHVGGDVTPETLSREGIPTLVLSESCIHADTASRPPTLHLLYDDEYRLGVVFGRAPQARTLIDGWKSRIHAVQNRLRGVTLTRVFLYDSGRDQPFTAGQDALATALVTLGGGINIFDDLPTNWGSVSWEAAALRAPQAIFIVDYGSGIDDQVAFLRHHPLMENSPAVRHGRIFRLRYDEVTPGPAAIDAVEAIARALHPERQ